MEAGDFVCCWGAADGGACLLRQLAEFALGEILEAGGKFAQEQAVVVDIFFRSRTADGVEIHLLGDENGAVEVEALAHEDRRLHIVDGAQVFHAGEGVDAVGVGGDGHRWNIGVEEIVAHRADLALRGVLTAADDDLVGGAVFVEGDGGVETFSEDRARRAVGLYPGAEHDNAVGVGVSELLWRGHVAGGRGKDEEVHEHTADRRQQDDRDQKLQPAGNVATRFFAAARRRRLFRAGWRCSAVRVRCICRTTARCLDWPTTSWRALLWHGKPPFVASRDHGYFSL